MTTTEVPSGIGARVPTAVLALFVPDVGMERAARTGRVRWALLFALVCSLALATAQALRIDARASTLKQLDTQRRLQAMSDRQIDDAQRSAERVFMVKRFAAGLAMPPASLLAAALALFGLSWFLRGRSQAGQIFIVGAFGLLPSALGQLIEAGAVFLRPSIAPDSGPLAARTLADFAAAAGLSFPGVAARLAGALDIYGLWTAVLLGCGLAAAASLPLRRALAGTLVGWLCVRLLAVSTGG